MERYYYDGPVRMFGKSVGWFAGETMAKSESEARRNLVFQAKKARGLTVGSKLELSGEVKRA